jgi:serine/threonine protein phosphatase PrpC
VALLHKSTLYVANAGDSRTILGRGAEPYFLSKDHKPDLPEEKNRIEKAGGFVSDGRVNGNLNLSRALGDLEYKQDKKLKPEE